MAQKEIGSLTCPTIVPDTSNAKEEIRSELLDQLRIRAINSRAGFPTKPLTPDDVIWLLDEIDQLDQLLIEKEQWVYGWSPWADSHVKFGTEEEAREAYRMAVEHPPKRWKRRIYPDSNWEEA